MEFGIQVKGLQSACLAGNQTWPWTRTMLVGFRKRACYFTVIITGAISFLSRSCQKEWHFHQVIIDPESLQCKLWRGEILTGWQWQTLEHLLCSRHYPRGPAEVRAVCWSGKCGRVRWQCCWNIGPFSLGIELVRISFLWSASAFHWTVKERVEFCVYNCCMPLRINLSKVFQVFVYVSVVLPTLRGALGWEPFLFGSPRARPFPSSEFDYN